MKKIKRLSATFREKAYKIITKLKMTDSAVIIRPSEPTEWMKKYFKNIMFIIFKIPEEDGDYENN